MSCERYMLRSFIKNSPHKLTYSNIIVFKNQMIYNKISLTGMCLCARAGQIKFVHSNSIQINMIL